MSSEIAAVASQAITATNTNVADALGQTAKVEQQTAQPEQAKEPIQVDSKLVAQAIDMLNQLAEAQQRNLKFSVDEPSGRTVIRVFDSNSDQLIRQIPGDEVLDLARRFGQGDIGALMNIVA